MSNVKISLAKEMYDAVYGDSVKESLTGVAPLTVGDGVVPLTLDNTNFKINTIQNCFPYNDYRYLLDYRYYRTERGFVQYELDSEYLIEIAIPGFKTEQFDLKLDINKLEVRAERPAYNVPVGYRTRSGCGLDYSGLTQTFTFDKKIDLDSAEANYDAGILTIKVKKVPDERSRTIKVK